MNANKEIVKSLLIGIVAGLILLTLMINFFNYKSSANNMIQMPKTTQKLINKVNVNTFTMPHTAYQIDKPVSIGKIKSPDESLKIETKLP